MRSMEGDKGEMLVYTGEDGLSHVNVRLQGETVWLTLEPVSYTHLFIDSRKAGASY